MTPGFVWGIARALVRVFYRVARVGEPLPAGAVLLVANHPNALLDPPIIVETSGRPPRFLAKSTLFSMPVVGWFVKGSGAIPVYRRSDAGADMSKNAEMFAAVERALAEGHAVCLFPEGISHSTGRVEALKTGAARIALAAADAGTDVRIVPVGLNYDSKAAFRSSALAAYGPPLAVRPWLAGAPADPAARVHALTHVIADHLRDVVIEADPRGDAELVFRVERTYAAARGIDDGDSEARLERRRRIASGMASLRTRDPERFGTLVAQYQQYERRMARFGLSEAGLARSLPRAAVVRFTLRETVLALVLVPVAVAGAIVFAVPYFIVDVLARRFTPSLEEGSTYKAGAGVLVYTIWIALLASWLSWDAGAWMGLAAAVLLTALGLAALFALERELHVLGIVRSYFANLTAAPVVGTRLSQQRAEIAELMDEAWKWINE